MILVVGATGMLGGNISKRLLAEGRAVRVLLRRDSPAQELATQGMATAPRALLEAGAEPVYGDLKEPASLAAAVEGVDTVITTANSVLRGGADTVESVDLHGNRALIEAATAAGVGRFIFTSGLTADANSPVPFLAAKGLAEQQLRESGMTYTITAPNSFMEVWIGMVVGGPALAGLPVTVVGSGERVHSFISRDDVAAFTVAALDNPAAHNARLVLGGPEALSFRDAASVFGELLGREVPVVSVEPGAPVPTIAEDMVPLVASFEMYDSPIAMDELCETYGVSLTPLETVARRMAAVTA